MKSKIEPLLQLSAARIAADFIKKRVFLLKCFDYRTCFDRPGFMAMMEEVEDGSVEAVIVKDMSRLDQDYLKAGQMMEILRQRGVRLIVINNNVDAAKGDNDMTPFSNLV